MGVKYNHKKLEQESPDSHKFAREFPIPTKMGKRYVPLDFPVSNELPALKTGIPDSATKREFPISTKREFPILAKRENAIPRAPTPPANPHFPVSTPQNCPNGRLDPKN